MPRVAHDPGCAGVSAMRGTCASPRGWRVGRDATRGTCSARGRGACGVRPRVAHDSGEARRARPNATRGNRTRQGGGELGSGLGLGLGRPKAFIPHAWLQGRPMRHLCDKGPRPALISAMKLLISRKALTMAFSTFSFSVCESSSGRSPMLMMSWAVILSIAHAWSQALGVEYVPVHVAEGQRHTSATSWPCRPACGRRTSHPSCTRVPCR